MGRAAGHLNECSSHLHPACVVALGPHVTVGTGTRYVGVAAVSSGNPHAKIREGLTGKMKMG